ncbi:MAG TPA: TonB-dependent receptor plug domain-containing protein [Mucilaginibacter sp.]|nr:TonB-dependent receptor plug domain-containing protein [Mucilaginibacter sp.]
MKKEKTVIARNEAISELCRSGKRRYLTAGVFVFVLLISVGVSAQNEDTLHKDTSAGSVKGPIAHGKALVVVDGVIYESDLKNIDPDDVSSVTVLKGQEATNIYGPKGANGVVIIQTKHYTPPLYKARPLDSAVSKDAFYVVDGVPSKNKLDSVNPKDILSISILKKGTNADASFEPVNDVVVVVTKKGAISAYQVKFGAFSRKYKDYIKRCNGNDSNLFYVINGVPIQGNPDNVIEALYKVPAKKIKAVGFNPSTGHERGTVIINIEE